MERPTTAADWTLETLAQLCARVLVDSGVGQQSGRVGVLPSARDIRYYATLGVVDRPSAYQGRIALYGRRHLLQLVALKRLQAQGRSLAEIQTKLLGLPDRALEPLAQLPNPLPTVAAPGEATAHVAAPAPARASRNRSAQDELPASVDAARGGHARGAFWLDAPAASKAPAPTAPLAPIAPRSLQEVLLAPGVRLQVEGLASLQSADLERLQTAAAPLIVLLRQLAAPDQEMP